MSKLNLAMSTTRSTGIARSVKPNARFGATRPPSP